MTGFLKIDTQTLTSTTYADKPAWDVFFAAMLIAAQYPPAKFDVDMPQLQVRTLEETGWVVPAGTYGFAPAAGVGIVNTAQIDHADGLAALERLGEPEPDSRSQAFEGRRLVRVDGGYVVLNMAEFRQRDQTAAERQKRRRAKLKAEARDVTRDVTAASRQVTEAEADGEAEAEAKKQEPADVSAVREFLFIARDACGEKVVRRKATKSHAKEIRRPFGGRKLTADEIEQWGVAIKHAAEHCRRCPEMATGVLTLGNLSQPAKFIKWLERDDLDQPDKSKPASRQPAPGESREL